MSDEKPSDDSKSGLEQQQPSIIELQTRLARLESHVFRIKLLLAAAIICVLVTEFAGSRAGAVVLIGVLLIAAGLVAVWCIGGFLHLFGAASKKPTNE